MFLSLPLLPFQCILRAMELFLFVRHSGVTTSTDYQANSTPDYPIEFVEEENCMASKAGLLCKALQA